MITQDHEQIRDAWDNIARGYDEFVTPTHMWLASEGLQRAGLRSGMHFLDVAAGTGALSIPAARLGAHVLSTDISPIMLECLKKRAHNGMLHLETRIMDGHKLKLRDNTFDVVGSQFGVMLFQDMPRGIREMVRVARPGGRVLMTVYGDSSKIEFFHFLVGAIQAAIPEFSGPPMDPPPLPFQLQDPEKLRREMVDAGLSHVRIDTITEKLEFRSEKQLWDWLTNSNPIVQHLLGELSLTQDQTTVVLRALEEKIRKRSGVRGYAALTNPINIGIGTK